MPWPTGTTVYGDGERGHEQDGPVHGGAVFVAVHTAAAATGCPCSVFSATSVPSTVTVNDANAVELGMKFRSDVAGTVAGVRFYKGAAIPAPIRVICGPLPGRCWRR